MYVDAFYDKNSDIVHVAERQKNGKRLLVEHKPEHVFYVADANGKHRTIHGERATEVRARNNRDFRKNLNMYNHVTKFESDIKPLNKTIAKHYNGVETPNLQTAFFDIETAFDKYAVPEDTIVRVRKKKGVL